MNILIRILLVLVATMVFFSNGYAEKLDLPKIVLVFPKEKIEKKPNESDEEFRKRKSDEEYEHHTDQTLIESCMSFYNQAIGTYEDNNERLIEVPIKFVRGRGDVEFAWTRDYKRNIPFLVMDLDDLEVFPEKGGIGNVPEWATTKCDIVIHEIAETAFLSKGLLEAGFDLKNIEGRKDLEEKRGMLMKKLYLWAHDQGVLIENEMRRARKVKQFRATSCGQTSSEKEKDRKKKCDSRGYCLNYFLIGNHTEITKQREGIFDTDFGIKYEPFVDMCRALGLEKFR